MFIPLGFSRNAKIIHLGFIKQIDIFRLGFIRKHNFFLVCLKKNAYFCTHVITNNKNLCI